VGSDGPIAVIPPLPHGCANGVASP
jgi:hypothetical protein